MSTRRGGHVHVDMATLKDLRTIGTRGDMNMASLKSISAGTIVAIGVGFYVLSAVLPGAFDNFFTANTTGWDAGTASLWTIIPLAAIAGVVLYFVPRGGGSS